MKFPGSDQFQRNLDLLIQPRELCPLNAEREQGGYPLKGMRVAKLEDRFKKKKLLVDDDDRTMPRGHKILRYN